MSTADELRLKDALRRALEDEATKQMLTKFFDDKAAGYSQQLISEAMNPHPDIIEIARNAASMDVCARVMAELAYALKIKV